MPEKTPELSVAIRLPARHRQAVNRGDVSHLPTSQFDINRHTVQQPWRDPYVEDVSPRGREVTAVGRDEDVAAADAEQGHRQGSRSTRDSRRDALRQRRAGLVADLSGNPRMKIHKVPNVSSSLWNAVPQVELSGTADPDVAEAKGHCRRSGLSKKVAVKIRAQDKQPVADRQVPARQSLETQFRRSPKTWAAAAFVARLDSLPNSNTSKCT